MPLFFVLIAVVGVAYGVDQRGKRIQEAERFRQAIRVLELRVMSMETQISDLEQRYGRMSAQYRELVALYWQQREELKRRRAAYAAYVSVD
ncbi:hypothetical protein [Corallococcus sp. AS-1-6]|uniref:hypothetical protein n=1 Tax=Corallococcus sp. AS-1-6 TaxID=2874599 RepID=UPI001CBAEABB|nr:hypothetical protein [Corallococcus sp. AS-1-6]MBZ4370211.1 hypothetical protein [Corallococcus sp. AS-1-6]